MFRKMFVKYKEKISVWYLLFSAMFSTMLIISCHIFYDPNNNSTVDTAYVSDFHIVDLMGIFLLIPLIYIIMKMVEFCFCAAATIFYEEKRKKNPWVLLAFWVIILLSWIPYVFSYFPGGIYADTVDSLNMALKKAELDNHNPILYTMIWRFAFWITGAFRGEGEYYGLFFFTIFQAVVLALILAGFAYFCYKKGMHKYFVGLLLLLFAVFPLYPFYGISLWKDTPFSIAVFVFAVYLFHVFSHNPEDITKGQLAGYGIGSVLIMFLRNNGIYIALFYSAVIVLMTVKNRRRIALKIGAVSLIAIAAAWIIQGPVYDKCGYNITKTVESLGVPIQQTAYILATDGNVNSEELEVLNEIMPLENWKALYNPVVVDTIKFDPSFNREYFQENVSEFIKVYAGLVMKNPVKAVKAYMLETLGFWNIFESSSTAYICNIHFGNAPYYQGDYFDYFFGISFRNLVEPKNYISAAIFVWMMLATISICLAKRYYVGIVPVLPTLGLWLSVMVAAPVAFSFRYVYGIFLCAPLYLIICIRAMVMKNEE